MKWYRFQFGVLARNTFGIAICNGVRILAQLAWVVLLARTLGAEGYGVFSGIAGLAITVGGFVGLGLGLKMYQDVAREPSLFVERWSQACMGVVWSIAPTGGILFLLAAMMFHEISLLTLLLIGGAELIGAPLVSLAAFAYASKGRVIAAAAAPVVMAIARVLAVLAMISIHARPELVTYATLHALFTGAAAVAVLASAALKLGAHWHPARLTFLEIKEGLGFSALWASGIAFGALDKALVLKDSNAGVAGAYAASQRFASIVAMPVEALVAAALPRMFRRGAGLQESPRLIPMLFLATSMYGMIAGVCLYWGADMLIWLLGPTFESTTAATRMLAIYVPVYSLRILAAHMLLAHGAVRYRVVAEILAIVVMAVAVSSWVPHLGVIGAAASLILTEMILLCLLTIGAFIYRRKEKIGDAVGTSTST